MWWVNRTYLHLAQKYLSADQIQFFESQLKMSRQIKEEN